MTEAQFDLPNLSLAVILIITDGGALVCRHYMGILDSLLQCRSGVNSGGDVLA